MNKIAIVEDRLKNAVLIARQLQDWLIRENLDNVIELKKVLLFSVSVIFLPPQFVLFHKPL